jgi:histidinol phosphatase-like PHP family hydrolase
MSEVLPCDYHIHYYADSCANPEMTLENIQKEALRLGLRETCVLKHYSRELPNGADKWMAWKRIVPEAFEAFLKDIRTFEADPRLRFFAGVETELVDDNGTVNISSQDAERLDALILSVHWLPRMKVATADPTLDVFNIQRSPPDVLRVWQKHVQECGAAALVENLAMAYVRAIEKNPKVLVLGHMFDGFYPLRTYQVPVDDVPEDILCRLMEPLMKVCAAHDVLWELTASPIRQPAILKRAHALGVKFCATADAHFLLVDGWGNLREHEKAEARIDEYGLTRGALKRA